jgi:hypothetical protein
MFAKQIQHMLLGTTHKKLMEFEEPSIIHTQHHFFKPNHMATTTMMNTLKEPLTGITV